MASFPVSFSGEISPDFRFPRHTRMLENRIELHKISKGDEIVLGMIEVSCIIR